MNIVKKLLENQVDYPTLKYFFNFCNYNELQNFEEYKKFINCEEIAEKKFIENHKDLYDMQNLCLDYFIKNVDLRNIYFDKMHFSTYVDKEVYDTYHEINEVGRRFYTQIMPYFLTKEKFNFLLTKFEEKLNKKLNKYTFASFLENHYDRSRVYYKIMAGTVISNYFVQYGVPISPFILGLLESEEDIFNMIMTRMIRYNVFSEDTYKLKDEIKKLFNINEDELIEKLNNFYKYLDNTKICEVSFFKEEYFEINSNYNYLNDNGELTKERFKEILNAIFLNKINIDKNNTLMEDKCMFLDLINYKNKLPSLFLHYFFLKDCSLDYYFDSKSRQFLYDINYSIKNMDYLKEYFLKEKIKYMLSRLFKLYCENIPSRKEARILISKFLENNDLEENLKKIIISLLIIVSKDDIKKCSFLKCKSQNKLIYKLCQTYNFECVDIINVLIENYVL
ncbi:MAG: hypothetical protein SOT71_07855 [Romboutsia timonensis]|uniref:hypothetical protein n=1 Tax=Romboutsia timonensis TaxID=1776391 RepID=UPI002A7500EC|nr:hypothetical protein [Romboutsia timonensis]MDY2882551.1 hypothetical protein [Romboutsia timonensis]